ncbi:hypothetical protein MACK_003794 [Theileria orientalis]|uniref:Major facilitator superfamily MFS-1 protein n=1 Tax=Theileria orientalis TaxID=68886 RepID=A0A976SIV1_THEOR|nr:hypothetical protein MACK_003794 [Theileria orientalis]
MKGSEEIKNDGSTKKWVLKIKDSREFSPPYIHPVIRFLIYTYIVLLTGNVFMGWTGFQELLYRAGSFEELCDISTSEFTTIRTHSIIDCSARKAAMNQLYTIAFSANFMFSFFSGAVLKIFCHKITFLFGHMVNFLCWFVMGLFPRNGTLLRIIMVIIGLTTETTYLPLTTVSLYFPEDKSLILCILGSIRTLSFFMPTILSYIYLSPGVKREQFHLVAITFGFIAYLGSFVIGIFIVPWNFFDTHGTGKSSVNQTNILPGFTRIKNCFSSCNQENCNKTCINANDMKLNTSTNETSCNTSYEGNTTNQGTNLVGINARSNTSSISSSKAQSEISVQKGSIKSQTLRSRFRKIPEDFRRIIKSPSTLQTILFTIAASLHIASVEFMNKAQRELFTATTGETVIPVFKYVQVLTFFPGLFIGYFADRYGTSETMTVIQIFLLASYLMLTVRKYMYMLVGCLFYTVGGSMYLSLVYFYIYETFAPENVGIALGFILLFSGTAIMCNIPLYNYALKIYYLGIFSKICWVLSGYMAVSLLSNVGAILLKRHGGNKILKNNQTSDVL